MNWLVYHIVSGQAFFSGIGLMVLSAWTRMQSRPAFRRLISLMFFAGLILMITSSTAIPYRYYAIVGAVTLAWLTLPSSSRSRKNATTSFIVVWMGAALLEAPFHFKPSLAPVSRRAVTIIGDSVTAGVEGDETSETWPQILAREHDCTVQDISHIGDTVASALKRARSQGVHASVVIIEIGGNDLLGSTTSAQFARDLDA